MKLRLHAFDLPLAHVFTISRGSLRSQPTLIVELEEDGLRGYGEATSNGYYGFTVRGMADVLEAQRGRIEAAVWQTPEEFWQAMQPALADQPFAHCALDQAAHDLWGKRHGKRVYEMWGLSADRNPASDYTIGIAPIDEMAAKMDEFPDWPIYKIKLGTADDLSIVEALRRRTGAVFRVDANCAWTAEQTLANAGEMKRLGVEFIEQPLPADRWDEMREVRRRCELPVIADESCIVEGDVDRCADAFHGVNIKLTKCAGLTPARRMIARARELNLSAMVGCMTESTVGISAIAQLLPLIDYVDMDGAVLLAHDVADGVKLVRGVCRYGDLPGCGVSLRSAGADPRQFTEPSQQSM
jgi:L-alanine-DL-glutamate epimerase-like enolase superfamily enzyme